MVWSTSDRRERLPADWHRRVAAVKARDGGICRYCGQTGAEVDHIVRGDDHDLCNLQLLCRECHASKTRIEAVAARTRVLRRRPLPADHPGLL